MSLRKTSLIFICILFSLSTLSWAAQINDTHSFNSPRPSKGKAFNPDISANFLGLLQRGTGVSDDRYIDSHNGLSLQEAEFQFTADVDAYLRAVALMAISQESGSTAFGIDPEEVYLETLALPVVTLRAGKFKLAMGKHNTLHAHAYPFIDEPLIHEQLLGDEGLNEVGISVAVLVPAPWYLEATAQAFSLSNETLFNSTKSGTTGGLVHLKNLWDFNEDLTMEFGVSGATGKNEFDKRARAYGADLTFKWRPSVGGKYQALIWSTEYLQGARKGLNNSITGESAEKIGGVASWLQYQFAQRWWIQGRYEYLGIPHSAGVKALSKQSTLLGFFPSEFSGVRLQYDRLISLGNNKTYHTIALQYNISIGAHPAHAY